MVPGEFKALLCIVWHNQGINQNIRGGQEGLVILTHSNGHQYRTKIFLTTNSALCPCLSQQLTIKFQIKTIPMKFYHEKTSIATKSRPLANQIYSRQGWTCFQETLNFSLSANSQTRNFLYKYSPVNMEAHKVVIIAFLKLSSIVLWWLSGWMEEN